MAGVICWKKTHERTDNKTKITVRIKLGICQNYFNIIINLELNVPEGTV